MQRTKKLVVICLLVFLMVASTACQSAPVSGTDTAVSPALPTATSPAASPTPVNAPTSDEAKALVADLYGKTVTVDPLAGTVLPYDGYYYGILEMPNDEPEYGKVAVRYWKEYIPEGFKRQDLEVLLNVPDGWNTEEFLIQSGWKSLSDELGFSLFILEPRPQGWAGVEEEAAYVEAAFIKRLGATTAGGIYVVGYGTGGTALQKYIMTQPMNVSAAVFINASDIDQEYLTTVGTTNLGSGNAAGSVGATTSEDNAKVTYGQIPLPVWIIEDDLKSASNVIDYWKTVNKSNATAEDFDGGQIYMQSEEILYEDTQEYEGKTYEFAHSATPAGLVANVATLQTSEDGIDPATSRMLWGDFLCKSFRYGSTIWSNILTAMPDYEEMGVDLLDLNYTVGDVEYKREFLVYQPKGYENAGDLPVVYIFPGGNQSHQVLLNATGWYKLAEEYGIIIVSVNGRTPFTTETGYTTSYTWGSGTDFTSDMLFMDKLMEYVNTNYPTDESRVYASGLWNFTQYLALNKPDVFAAQGSVSAWGSTYYENEHNAGSDLATFTMVGENDMGAPVIGETPEMVTTRLTMKGYNMDDLVLVENVISDIDPRYIVNEYYVKGSDGNPTGEPLIRFGWVFDRGHSFLQTDYRIIWETWFSHWTVDTTTGEHTYTE